MTYKRVNLRLSKSIVTDSNYFHRRVFRLWMDGSYTDHSDYLKNVRFIVDHWDDETKLKMYAIAGFQNAMACEFSCSATTVQQRMVSFFELEELKQLNIELIDDLRDLGRNQWEVENNG